MRENRTDIALLLLRIILGVVFIVHGGQKVLGWAGGPGLDGFVGHMASMHMPAVFGYLVAFGELLGGLGLLVGLLTRIAALGPVAAMAGAVLLVHLKNGFLNEGAKAGYEYPLTLLVVALAVMIAGPGRYSLDALLHRGRELRVPSSTMPQMA